MTAPRQSANLERRRTLALVAGVVAVIAWAVGPIFVSSLSISLPTTVLYRQLIWLPLLFTLAHTAGDGFTKHHFQVAWKPGIFFALSTALGFGSFKETTIANATLIGSLTPALLLFLAPRILGEKITAKRVVYSLVSFVGVIAVVIGAESAGNTTEHSLFGDALAFANMAIWTVYFIAAKRARDEGMNTWSFLTGICLTNVLLALPWALISSDDLLDVKPRDWLFLVLMMLIPGTMGHYMMTWAQRYLDTTVSSLITLGGPVMSTTLAFIFLGQGIALVQVLGGVVVLLGLGGVILSTTSARATKSDTVGTADPLLNSNP
ncbi:MAG: DMT family transporter [Actinomycetota bacterium]